MSCIRYPAHWTHQKLKFVASLRSGESITSDNISAAGEYPVYGGNGVRGYTSSYTHEGTYPVIGRQGALCGNVNYATGRFWASEHAVVVNVHDGHAARWLGEVLRSMNLNQYSQSAAQPGISVEVIENLPVPVPPKPEQEVIANYLDCETARIDGLIAEKERMLVLLEEKRDALISRVVTRGLDPKAPLKPSGQEWLGEIPAHWHMLRLKFATSGIDQGSSPQCYSYPAESGQWGVLKTGCVNGGEFREHENKALPDETEAFTESEAHQGDVLMSRASGSVDLIGSVAHVARQPSARLLLSDKIYRLRVKRDVLSPRFMVLAMGARYLRHQIKSVISGAEGLANNIAKSDVMELLLVVPPVFEQERIISYLDRAIRSNQMLWDALCQSITLAKERRAALITAAVNGQIDVRGKNLNGGCHHGAL
jgi:type I restriction enzyme, S subunit